ncbi:MAG TPA: hypothetical protein VL123_05015 [Candidatus Udaeobacter sp.]|jgi:hypothetical protein|nr:hypothetical protein [Candidatus Udaeobacter sp.]
MGFGTGDVTAQLRSHRMISAGQYAIAAAAAIASAGFWWLVTRQLLVPVMIAAIGLVQPLTTHRDNERTGRRILWAFGFGAFVAAVHALFRWMGWAR